MTAGPLTDTTALEAYQAGDPAAVLEQATAQVRSMCGWHVAPSIADTFTAPACDAAVLILPTLHVTAIASVTVGGTVLDPARYRWRRSGVVMLGCGAPLADVVVSFTHGFDVAEVADLVQVILAQATRMQQNPTAATSLTTGPFGQQYAGLDPRELAVVERYKLPARP